MNNNGMELKTIKLTDIRPDPHQPRRNFDETTLQELADSIKEHGLMQPPAVYQNGTGYIIEHGERRWRASQLAGLNQIPCVIINKTDDTTTLLLRQFTENNQREPLNPIEEAHAFQKLINAGLSRLEISARLGKRHTYAVTISARLIWLQLEPEIQAHVANGRLPRDQRVAKALLKLPPQARTQLAHKLADTQADIKTCLTAASNLRTALKNQQKPRQTAVNVPLIRLSGAEDATTTKTHTWDTIRTTARAMCGDCAWKSTTGQPEPAWTLIAQIADQVCHDCGLIQFPDACQQCPGVALLKGLVQS